MSRGFTLIELLIVLVITGLITGGGLLYLSRSNSLQKINTSKQEVLSNLRFARNLAITDQKPSGFGNLAQVNVSLSSNGTMVLKPIDITGAAGPNYLSKDLTPDGVTVTLSAGTTFGFSSYEGRFIGVGNTLVITFSSVELSVGDTKQLIITQSGLINDL